MKKRVFLGVILFLALLIIGLRLALPHYLLQYVEGQINKIPEYRVKIADLDVDLYRGAYSLKNIKLWKITKNIPVPFYEAKVMDFSLEWAALLQGSVVAKIIVQEPKINFVTDPSGKNEQLTINKQWLQVVKSLYPLNINLLEGHKGEISFISYKGHPPFKIYLKNAEFKIENMQKTTEEDELLSSAFMLKGDVTGGGNILVKGSLSPFKKQPTFKLITDLTKLQVASIGSLLKHYSDVDVSGGSFSLYGEAVAANGKIEGYIKPFIKDLKISPPKKDLNPVSAVVDSAATVVAKILQNPNQKTIATKINIRGNVDDPDTSVWSIIGYLIRHAFIQALLPQIDHSVKMQDVIVGKQTQPPKTTGPVFPQYRG